MLIDPRLERLPSRLSAEVVVVGAGAAGITLALELGDAGVDVLVLESGSTQVGDPDVHGLTGGEVGPMAPYDLESARARVLGGTTAYWTGFCRPLEEVDLASRAWVDGPGWPIGASDLADGYAVAKRLVEIGDEPFDLAYWAPRLRAAQILPLEGDVLTTSVFRVSPPTRFGERYRVALEDAPTVRVVLRTTVLDLVERAGGGAIESLVVTTADGELVSIEADVVVLAVGGLEVPRLLLHAGIGNEHDNVGRYFMEHPHVPLAIAAFTSRFEREVSSLAYGFPFEVDDRMVLLHLTLADDVVAEERLLRGGFSFAGPPDLAEAAQAATVASLVGDTTGTGAGDVRGLYLRGEQRPSRHNRVELDPGTVDRFGMPMLRVRWEVSAEDRADHLRALDLVARELGLAGYGRVRPRDDANFAFGVHHHMGGACMSDDARAGVVDANLRVHGQANLYVASSAAFPTGGYANPTLTIVALAARLAAHLTGAA